MQSFRARITVVALVSLLAVTGAIPAIAATPDETIRDGDTYWQGQTLTRSNGISDGATVALRATTHDFYREYAADNGQVTFDTDGFDPGTYSLRVNGDEISRFHLEKQSLSGSVHDKDRTNGTVTFAFDSSRAQSDLYVHADDLDADALEHIFRHEDVTRSDVDDDDATEVVLQGVSREERVEGDFENHRGTHTLQFDVVDSTAKTDTEFTIRRPSYQQAALLADPIREDIGDVATFRVAFADTDRARLTVGGPEVNYYLNFTVVDRDGDGRAKLGVRTPDMGQSRQTIVAYGDDYVRNVSETSLSSRVEPSDYPVTLRDMSGDTDDLATLKLSEGRSLGTSIRTYPGDETPDDYQGLWNGTERATVPNGESLALVFNVSGVFATMDDASAADLEQGVGGISLSIRESELGQNQPERQELEVSNGHLVTHEPSDTVAFVVDTDDVDAETGESYQARLAFEDDHHDNLTATFEVVERQAWFTTTDLYAEQTTVSGTTTFTDGTAITVKFYSKDGAFTQRRQTVVGENGTFSASVDLRDLGGEPLSMRVAGVTQWRQFDVQNGSGPQTTTTTATPTTATTTAQAPTTTTTATATTSTATPTTPTTATGPGETTGDNEGISLGGGTTTTDPGSQNTDDNGGGGLLSGLGWWVAVPVVLFGLAALLLR